MNLNTVHQNFDTKEEFEKMLAVHKPITVNKAIDILGYIIAKDETDYLESLFNAIEDDETRSVVYDAVSKLDDSHLLTKNTVKAIVGTSVDITKLIVGESDSEDDLVSSSSSDNEWDSDDEYNFKV